jgi:hypothetical protein
MVARIARFWDKNMHSSGAPINWVHRGTHTFHLTIRDFEAGAIVYLTADVEQVFNDLVCMQPQRRQLQGYVGKTAVVSQRHRTPRGKAISFVAKGCGPNCFPEVEVPANGPGGPTIGSFRLDSA